MTTRCERCNVGPQEFAIALTDPDDDPLRVIHFWCSECIEDVVYGVDYAVASRYLGHRPLPSP